MGCTDHPAAATLPADPMIEVLKCDFCELSTEAVAGGPMRGCEKCGRALRLDGTVVGRCAEPGCAATIVR
jgi:hypothetical protein